MVSPRRTRLRSRKLDLLNDVPTVPKTTTLPSTSRPVALAPAGDTEPSKKAIQVLPARLTSTLTKLSRQDHQLLLRKQRVLQKYSIEIPRDFRKHDASVQSTLVFAQEEAGTAVCVSRDGLLLTCSHCVAEDDEEPGFERLFWLLFTSGRAVAARFVAWDERRDLALLRIVAAQTDGDTVDSFPFAHIADTAPTLGDRLVCIGHPGSEDFEAAVPGVKTHYDVLHLSTGAFRGYAEGQDLQDNSGIGALQHDCWTYWGHSGAPLLERRSGELVGLHSSWDDETAMRRGVPLEAITAFMTENKPK